LYHPILDTMEANINFMSIWESEAMSFPWLKRIFSRPKLPAKKLITPQVIGNCCSGIQLGNSLVRSVIFSTDMALIENNDADAVLAVYPFAPSPKIMKSLIDFAEKPVICGVGGGLTQGKVSLEMAIVAENYGAVAIIVNQPFKNKHIELIKKKIKIPVISSISVAGFPIRDRANAGVDIFHVTGGVNTSAIIEHIQYAAPGYPIISTGGKTVESIRTSIKSGANAIVLSPPSSGELFKGIMSQYRKGLII